MIGVVPIEATIEQIGLGHAGANGETFAMVGVRVLVGTPSGYAIRDVVVPFVATNPPPREGPSDPRAAQLIVR
jgi:hypothetical protein